MTRYAPFAPVVTIKCEWCGKRIATDHAIMEAHTKQCYCNEVCFGHAGGLREALLIATKTGRYVYTGSRGATIGQRSRVTFNDLVAEALRQIHEKG